MMEIKDKFSQKMFFRLWWPGTVVAIPYAISEAIGSMTLGNNMGTVGLAVLGFCVPILTLSDTIAKSFGMGGANRFSILMGKGDMENAKKCFNDVVKAVIALGIILAVLGIIFLEQIIYFLGVNSGDDLLYQSVDSYLSISFLSLPFYFAYSVIIDYLVNDNCQGIANIVNIVYSAANIFLTFIFVVFFDMGAAGASLSLLVSAFLALLCFVPALRREESHLLFTDWKIDFRQVARCFNSGFSVTVFLLYYAIFFTVANNALVRIMGEPGVAILAMLDCVSNLFLRLFFGNSKALQPLVSTYVGERYFSGIRLAKKMGFISAIGVSTLLAAIIIAYPSAMFSLFGYNDQENMAEACFALRVSSISCIFASIYACYNSFYQAAGKEKWVFAISTFKGVSLIVCVILFSWLLPDKVWLFYPVVEIAVVLLYFILDLFQKKEIAFDENRVFVRTIENKTEDLVAIADELESFGKKWSFTDEQIYFLRLGVEELVSVMLKYGFSKEDKGYIHMTAVAELDGTASFHMRDTAGKFNPFNEETKRNASLLLKDIDEKKFDPLAKGTDKVNADGNFDMDFMGIMVLKDKAKSFSYRHYQGFNAMTLKF